MYPKVVLPFARRLIIILCVAAILFAAFSPASSAQFLCQLSPLWYFALFIITGWIYCNTERRISRRRPFLPVVSSRPPPIE